MKQAVFIAVALAAAACSSCGYALVRPGAALPASIRSVYVAPIEVEGKDLLVADEVARRLRREMRRKGRMVPVASAAQADATLHVRVLDDRVRSTGFDEFDEALAYDSRMIADARLVDAAGNELWARKGIGLVRNHAAVPGAVVTSSSSFQSRERIDPRDLQAFDGVQLGENRRTVARERLTVDLAREIHAAIADGL